VASDCHRKWCANSLLAGETVDLKVHARFYLGARFPKNSDRTRTIGPGEGTPQAFGIVKTAFLLRKVVRPGGLELPTFWFVAR
jgi:hypothetical protein